MNPRVLILGGGVGGIVASKVLKKTLGREVNVLVVDRNRSHHYVSSLPLLATGARKPEDITRRLDKSFYEQGIEYLNAEITGLEPENKTVITDKEKLTYDYLVIALGAEYHPETVPGFRKNVLNGYDFDDVLELRKELADFDEGNIVVFITSLPFKCPPAPYEMMFLLDEYFRKRGKRHKVKLTLVTPEQRPEPIAGPLVSRSIRNMLEDRGISLKTGARILEVASKSLILDQGVKIPGDLFIGVPSHWGPRCLRETGLVDGFGWVKVHPFKLQTALPDVYAVGDCTGIKLPVSETYAPKAGIFAHYQAEVVGRNIARLIKGQLPNFSYTGKGA